MILVYNNTRYQICLRASHKVPVRVFLQFRFFRVGYPIGHAITTAFDIAMQMVPFMTPNLFVAALFSSHCAMSVLRIFFLRNSSTKEPATNFHY